jgi:hypothetical protein
MSLDRLFWYNGLLLIGGLCTGEGFVDPFETMLPMVVAQAFALLPCGRFNKGLGRSRPLRKAESTVEIPTRRSLVTYWESTEYASPSDVQRHPRWVGIRFIGRCPLSVAGSKQPPLSLLQELEPVLVDYEIGIVFLDRFRHLGCRRSRRHIRATIGGDENRAL